MLKKIFIIAIIPVFLVTAGLGCKMQSKAEREATRPIHLTWWRVIDNADKVGDILGKYRQVHPNIGITYRKLRLEEYEGELLDAMAEDRGPDIFTIHNTSLIKYKSKLLPLPRELTMAYQVEKGTVKKEIVTELRKERSLRVDQLKNQYLDVVAKDVVLLHRAQDGSVSEKIFALPLAIDTMVLYANRDLLNSAGIPQPATTWEEFLDHVKRLTKLDAQGNILQAGAALGTADNVERATDLLALLMMQNGTVMLESGAVFFNQMPPGSVREELPGPEALRFYTDFANPVKEAYTWHEGMPNSFEAFTAGTVGYFFGYSYHLPTIKARAPKLNLATVAVPQIDPTQPVYFANYWVEAVSNKTNNPDAAWDFIQFASRAENVGSYLERAGKPTATRTLIPAQLEDEEMSVFAAGLLTTKSWYQGADYAAAESAIKEMIRVVQKGEMLPVEAAGIAAAKVSQTLW